MSSKKRRRENASTRESYALEDVYFGGQHDHKTVQLCHQVSEAISIALASSTNPTLQDLYVESVHPLRGAALLRVFVRQTGEEEVQQLEDALSRAQGYLRGQIASEINRKRVPNLSFVVLPRGVHDDE